MSVRVDYLCRGMGWAHAARTAAVVPDLVRRPGISDVAVAAAGSAVGYFDLVGMPCHDLRVPDDADHSAYAAYRIRRHLAERGTADRVVVSDELCLAPLLCRADGVRCVLVVCSFRHYGVGARAFAAADRVLLASWPEVDPVPAALRHKVTAIGPIVRMTPRGGAPLGLPDTGLVVTVSLGSYHPTKVAYFRAALRTAVDAWRYAPADAVLVVPLPAAAVADLLGAPPPGNVWCVGATGRLDAYHVASAVVLTMGGSTTSHAVRNGIPTIVLNTLTESRERRVARHLADRSAHVAATDATGDGRVLWSLVERFATAGRVPPPDLRWGSAQDVADAVAGCETDHARTVPPQGVHEVVAPGEVGGVRPRDAALDQ
ncbi:hypothetical protein [Actinophytocola sp. KF-1]